MRLAHRLLPAINLLNTTASGEQRRSSALAAGPANAGANAPVHRRLVVCSAAARPDLHSGAAAAGVRLPAEQGARLAGAQHPGGAAVLIGHARRAAQVRGVLRNRACNAQWTCHLCVQGPFGMPQTTTQYTQPNILLKCPAWPVSMPSQTCSGGACIAVTVCLRCMPPKQPKPGYEEQPVPLELEIAGALL